jgi:hypothetical protein
MTRAEELDIKRNIKEGSYMRKIPGMKKVNLKEGLHNCQFADPLPKNALITSRYSNPKEVDLTADQILKRKEDMWL